MCVCVCMCVVCVYVCKQKGQTKRRREQEMRRGWNVGTYNDLTRDEVDAVYAAQPPAPDKSIRARRGRGGETLRERERANERRDRGRTSHNGEASSP